MLHRLSPQKRPNASHLPPQFAPQRAGVSTSKSDLEQRKLTNGCPCGKNTRVGVVILLQTNAQSGPQAYVKIDDSFCRVEVSTRRMCVTGAELEVTSNDQAPTLGR